MPWWTIPAIISASGAAGYGAYKAGKRKDQPFPNLTIPNNALTDYPSGKAVNQVILDMLQGGAAGFPEGFTNAVTSPFIASLRASWPETQRDIKEAYSSRGFGKSTQAARGETEAAQQRQRDVNELIAKATLMGEEQKKKDLGFWGKLGAYFADTESQRAAQRAGLANQYNMARYSDEEARDKQRIANLNRAIGMGLKTFGSGMDLAGYGNVGDAVNNLFGGSGSNIDIDRMIDALKKAGSTGGGGMASRPFTNPSWPRQSAGWPQ